jgi:RNA polymerase sigma-70 factor (ECF subfamily)
MSEEIRLTMKPVDATESAFNELYERHVDTVYRVCYAMMGNRPDAEDAVQSVFVKLMRSRPAFRGVEHEKAWLIATARNHCRDELRRWWKKKVVRLDSGINDARNAGRIPEDDMTESLLRLAPRHRLLLYLHYYEGYKLHEIAEMLGMNLNTVKTRLRDARKRLKLELEEDAHEQGTAARRV